MSSALGGLSGSRSSLCLLTKDRNKEELFFSLQQLVLGDDTEAITSKITPARILKAKSLFEMERFEHQRERTLLFSQLPLPSFSRIFLFMMTTKQHHYKNREHKF